MIDGSHAREETVAEPSRALQSGAPPAGGGSPLRLELLRGGASGLLLGFLAGVQVAGLLFFLNPDLPFHTSAVARAIAVFGGLLGGVGLVLLLAIPPLRRAAGRWRGIPWGLTLVLTLAATAGWAHASFLSFYLPPGINDRLIKAALWLTLLALLGFYTALLHSVQRRRYGPRSRLLLALIVAAAIYVPFERREAFHQEPPKPPRLVGFSSADRPQLLVVGLSGATLDAVLPLAEQGRLPFVSGMLHIGASGRLTSLTPTRPVALWTTLATGKWPYKHGIVSRRIVPAAIVAPAASFRLTPVGIGWSLWGRVCEPSRAVLPTDRRAMPLWSLLTRLGLRVVVVDWPLSGPGEEAGRVLSDRFFAHPGAPGGAYPEDLAARAERFRPDRAELAAELRMAFGSPPPEPLLPALEGDLWRSSAARALLGEAGGWDAAFLVLPGLAEASEQLFGGFAAVQFEGSTRSADRKAADQLASYYAVVDRELARLWSAMRPPRLMVLVSAVGAEPRPGWWRVWRELSLQSRVAGTVRSGGDGVLLLAGEGVRSGAPIEGARLVDLAPTLLYALGFPVARDLDGEVLTEGLETGFLARHPLAFVPSYEALPLP